MSDDERLISEFDHQKLYDDFAIIDMYLQEQDNIYTGICLLNDDDEDSKKKSTKPDEKLHRIIIITEKEIRREIEEYYSKLPLGDKAEILDIQRKHPCLYESDLSSMIGDYFKVKGSYFFNLIDKPIDDIKLKQTISEFKIIYPNDKALVGNIQNRYSHLNLEDLCYKLGYALQYPAWNHAEFFYNLAAKGVRIYTMNNSQDSLGWMYLDNFNREIKWGKPSEPTESLLHNITLAVFAFGESFNDVLYIPLRFTAYKIVTWFIDSRRLDEGLFTRFNDMSYKGYILHLFQSIQSIKDIFKAKSYGFSTTADLLNQLIQYGFIGFKQYDNNYDFHHIWYRDGFIVRVKRHPDSYAEYTVGFVLVDPLISDMTGKPMSLRLDKHGRPLIFKQNNEVCKVAKYCSKGKIIYLPIPSRHDDLWYIPNENNLMNNAHFRLTKFKQDSCEKYLHTFDRNFVLF